MSWDAIAASAEVIGAIAIVITLVYLAVQLRQNNVLLKEQAKYHMLQNQISYHDYLSHEPDFVRTMYGEDASESENLRLRRESAAISIFFRWNWEFLRAKESIFGVADVPAEAFAWEFKKAHLGEFWDDIKHIYDSEFVAFMDSAVVPTTNRRDDSLS